jgi:hypothetical protein
MIHVKNDNKKHGFQGEWLHPWILGTFLLLGTLQGRMEKRRKNNS